MEKEGCYKKQLITAFSHLLKEIAMHSRESRKSGEAKVLTEERDVRVRC